MINSFVDDIRTTLIRLGKTAEYDSGNHCFVDRHATKSRKCLSLALVFSIIQNNVTGLMVKLNYFSSDLSAYKE